MLLILGKHHLEPYADVGHIGQAAFWILLHALVGYVSAMIANIIGVGPPNILMFHFFTIHQAKQCSPISTVVGLRFLSFKNTSLPIPSMGMVYIYLHWLIFLYQM